MASMRQVPSCKGSPPASYCSDPQIYQVFSSPEMRFEFCADSVRMPHISSMNRVSSPKFLVKTSKSLLLF
jgi:hypothetical protein